MVQVQFQVREKVPGEKVLEELRDFYDCVREFDVMIPFPLRVFVKKALLDAGKKEWAAEMHGMYEEEGVFYRMMERRSSEMRGVLF